MSIDKDKIKKILALDRDPKTFLFDHIENNDKEHRELYEEIQETEKELNERIDTIELTPGPQGDSIVGQQGPKGDSIKGDKGDSIRGKDGKNADEEKIIKEVTKNIPNPIDGVDGLPGEKGDKVKHEWDGTKLRFENPLGGWGKFIDLKGPRGIRGLEGDVPGNTFGSTVIVKDEGNLITDGASVLDFVNDGVSVSKAGQDTIINVLGEAFYDTKYLRLDTTNDPITGNLDIGSNNLENVAKIGASLDNDLIELTANKVTVNGDVSLTSNKITFGDGTTYFIINGTTLQLFVAGGLIQTWTGSAAVPVTGNPIGLLLGLTYA